MAAATCVFETYELLECTLLHLPLRDLLLAERVCRTWQEVTHKSHTISKVLFRRPVPLDIEDPVLNPFFGSFTDHLDMLTQQLHAMPKPGEQTVPRSAWHFQEASWKKVSPAQGMPYSLSYLCKTDMDRSGCFFGMGGSPGHKGRNTTMDDICKFLNEQVEKNPQYFIVVEVAYAETVPASSMRSLSHAIVPESGTTGWECMRLLEGYKGAKACTSST